MTNRRFPGSKGGSKTSQADLPVHGPELPLGGDREEGDCRQRWGKGGCLIYQVVALYTYVCVHISLSIYIFFLLWLNGFVEEKKQEMIG